MSQQQRTPVSDDRLIFGIMVFLGIVGIALRLVYYFQNNNLIIDEANIARNLAERDFAGLTLPLRYEQYAPPVFLWIEKGFSIVLGFSEKALRLYPLATGIAAIFVFYKILSRFQVRLGSWYPFALLALGAVYVKHTVEVKQYMPDVLIGLLLILLALKVDLEKTDKKRFVIIWMLAGSIAVWSSMTSVFILAGIGAYYTWRAVVANKREQMIWIALPSLLWLVQFIIYYQFILKQQITSSYLQNYHQHYFLFALPSSPEEWMHNGRRLLGFFGDAGGFTFLALLFNGLLWCVGMIQLIKKKKDILLLTLLPIALLFLAAALHHYALVERLVLFSLPLVLMIMAFGLDVIFRTCHWAIKAGLMVVALICIQNYSMLHIFLRREAFHEITEGLSYLKEKHVSGHQLFIHNSSGDSYLYYTQLHPGKESWKDLYGATILKWDSNYTVETQNLQDTVYFLYTGGFPPEERQKRVSEIEVNMTQVDYFEKYVCYVFGYVPKAAGE
jgi:hypothetical protein